MKQVIIPLLLMLLFASFTNRRTDVKLVFQNNTAKDFMVLKVNVRGKEFVFKNIQQGARTTAIHVPETYRYCYAQAITATDTLICQPTDYVGEKMYHSGKFLMKLFSLPGQKYMGMDFEALPR